VWSRSSATHVVTPASGLVEMAYNRRPPPRGDGWNGTRDDAAEHPGTADPGHGPTKSLHRGVARNRIQNVTSSTLRRARRFEELL